MVLQNYFFLPASQNTWICKHRDGNLYFCHLWILLQQKNCLPNGNLHKGRYLCPHRVRASDRLASRAGVCIPLGLVQKSSLCTYKHKHGMNVHIVCSSVCRAYILEGKRARTNNYMARAHNNER
jgi:hypothetical protein